VGPGPHVIGWEPWCASGETLPVTLRVPAGKSTFKKGFTLRIASMSCFSPTRGALSPSSFLRPFAFKVPALCHHSLPWPCDFIPSTPNLSECLKWYITCLDGMHRRSAEEFAPVLSILMSLPLESLCLLPSLAGRCYRSCFSSVGDARPCGSGALPPVLGFKDFHHAARLQSPTSGHLQG
jgi:hypothetical protein